MKQILFDEYLKEQMKIKGLTYNDVCFKTTGRKDLFGDIINGFHVPGRKNTIKRIARNFDLDFKEVYDLAIECRLNISGIFMKCEQLEKKILSDELKKVRIITLGEMAIKAGVNESCLKEIESGQKTLIAKSVLKKLSKGYGIPFGYILNYSKGFGVV